MTIAKYHGIIVSTFICLLFVAAPARAEHYELKRHVFRVELTGTPLARIFCTVREDATGATDTVAWLPEDKHGNVRYALLPRIGAASNATGDAGRTVTCRSESLALGEDANTVRVLFYAAAGPQPITAGRATLDLRLSSIAGAGTTQLTVGPDVTTQGGLKVNVSLCADAERQRVLKQRNDGAQTSLLRSDDPTTIFAEALTAFATYALGSAKNASKEYARRVVRDYLCGALTVKAVKDGLDNSALARALTQLKWPDDRYLLQSTCALVQTLRIDELVAARDAIWRAIGADAAALSAELLGATLSKDESKLRELVQNTSALLASVLTGGTKVSERDAQTLILALGKLGFSSTGGKPVYGDWQYQMEVGMAVLQECLRDSDCSADRLARMLAEEVELIVLEDPAAKDGLAGWPELGAILGRAASVLRPPPGTAPRLTVANAVGVILDVVDHVLSDSFQELPPAPNTDAGAADPACAASEASSTSQLGCTLTELRKAKGDKVASDAVKVLESYLFVPQGTKARDFESARILVRTLRGIVAALQGGDVTTAVVEFQRVFDSAIVDACTARGEVCKIPLTQSQLRRGFRIIAALANYGASYSHDGAERSAEVEKQRNEERRKAVESLVDAVTDRSGRSGDWVFSLGSNVAVGLDARVPNKARGTEAEQQPHSDDPYVNQVPLSLATGVALQNLPGDGKSVGWHFMLQFVDLAQYATTGGEDGSTAKPEITSAIRMGAQAGLLFGEPDFPIVLSGHFGWVPKVKYANVERDELSYGLSLGVFVPFVDFN